MSNPTTTKPTWRTGIIAAAAKVRAMALNAAESDRRHHRELTADGWSAAAALDSVARDLAYLASLQPHEGLAQMRKLGDDKSRAWAEEFARTGFEPKHKLALTVEEQQLVRDNQIIPAIKSLRERTGCGLMEAKQQIDANR